MKRKREVEKKTEIKSAIDELSLLVNIIRSKHNTTANNNNNSNNNDDNNSLKAVVETITSDADNRLQQQQIHQQQVVRVDLNIPARPFLSFCSLIIQILVLCEDGQPYTHCVADHSSDASYKIGPTMAVMRQDINKNVQRLEKICDSDPTTYSNLVEILNKEAVDRCAKKGDSCSKALLWLTRSLDFTAALLQKLVVEPRDSMEQIVASSYETTLKPWHGWISATAYKVALKLVPETDTFICLLMDKGETIDAFKHNLQCLISLLVPLLEDLHSTLSSYGLERLKST